MSDRSYEYLLPPFEAAPPPTLETAWLFESGLEQLRRADGLMHTHEERTVRHVVGATQDVWATIFASLRELRNPGTPDRNNAMISIVVQDAVQEGGVSQRSMRNGQTHSKNMNDAAFQEALAGLQLYLSEAESAWFDRACKAAGDCDDHGFLSYCVTELIEDRPPGIELAHCKQLTLVNAAFADGSVVDVASWHETNTAGTAHKDSGMPRRTLRLLGPDGIIYQYAQFVDNTEVATVEAAHPQAFRAAQAAGLVVTAAESWADIPPHDRLAGRGRPTELLLGRFARQLQTALTSGQQIVKSSS